MFAKTFALAVSLAAVQAVKLNKMNNLTTDPDVITIINVSPTAQRVYDADEDDETKDLTPEEIRQASTFLKFLDKYYDAKAEGDNSKEGEETAQKKKPVDTVAPVQKRDP